MQHNNNAYSYKLKSIHRAQTPANADCTCWWQWQNLWRWSIKTI